MTLPPVIRLSGLSPSQDAKHLAVAQLVMSVPISLITFNAVKPSMPSIRVRPTPEQRQLTLPVATIKDVRFVPRSEMAEMTIYPEEVKTTFWHDLASEFSGTRCLGVQKSESKTYLDIQAETY